MVLVRAPFPCNEKTVEMTNTVMDWADTHEVELINCMKVTDVIGLNFEEDSLDAGTHLNESGGNKLSKSVQIIYVTLTTMNASTILQQDLCI